MLPSQALRVGARDDFDAPLMPQRLNAHGPGTTENPTVTHVSAAFGQCPQLNNPPVTACPDTVMQGLCRLVA